MARKKAAQAIMDMSGTARTLPAGADLSLDDYLKQGYRPPPIETGSGRAIGGASQLPPPRTPASTGLIRRTLGRTALGAVAVPVAEQLISAAVPAIDSGQGYGYGDAAEMMTFGTLPSDRPMRTTPAANYAEAPRAASAAVQAMPNQTTAETNRLLAANTTAGLPTPAGRGVSPEEAERMYLQARALTGFGSGAKAREQLTQLRGQDVQAESAAATRGLRESMFRATDLQNTIKGLRDSLDPMKAGALPSADRAQLQRRLAILEATQAFNQGLLPQETYMQIISGAENKAEGGLVGVPGYADGGEVFMEEDMDMPMAIDPTAAGAAASMESGDYVFPVEAVQFYGLKMLKDMVKRAMTAE
jgi:hypothetical protein